MSKSRTGAAQRRPDIVRAGTRTQHTASPGGCGVPVLNALTIAILLATFGAMAVFLLVAFFPN
ncbi:MAG TPA: hypothetical protein VJL59_19415, partial [Anaerolineales bacterium]|nr:hypothetical protein [Anaerolineales bacterium]